MGVTFAVLLNCDLTRHIKYSGCFHLYNGLGNPHIGITVIIKLLPSVIFNNSTGSRIRTSLMQNRERVIAPWLSSVGKAYSMDRSEVDSQTALRA